MSEKNKKKMGRPKHKPAPKYTENLAQSPDIVDKLTKESFELDEKDRVILKLKMEHPEYNAFQIGEALGIDRQSVYERTRKPAYKRAMADIAKNLVDLIKENQTLAARRLRNLIQSTDEMIALNATRFALGPIFNQGTLHVHNVHERIYRVQFGDGGGLTNDVIELDQDGKPTTSELVSGIFPATAV